MRVARVYLYTVLAALAEKEDYPRLATDPEGSVALRGIPMPPSLNEAYANARKGRVLTTEALKWQYDCNSWALDNLAPLCKLRDLGARKIPLAVEAVFYLPHSALFTKKGEPKPWDPPNFSKLLIDHLSTYAQMNDTLFFLYIFDKRAVTGPDRRYVDVKVWIR